MILLLFYLFWRIYVCECARNTCSIVPYLFVDNKTWMDEMMFYAWSIIIVLCVFVTFYFYDHYFFCRHNSSSTESDLKTTYSKSFRYDIAAWTIGAVLLVCFLVVIVYPRAKRRNEVTSSSCYTFPANSSLKAETDSTSIIGNTVSETT